MKNKEAKKKALESLFEFLKGEGKERMKQKKMAVKVEADSKKELIEGLEKAKEVVKNQPEENNNKKKEDSKC